MNFYKFFSVFLFFLFFDYLFLSFFGPKFILMVQNIQNKRVTLNYFTMFITYLIMTFQLYYFIIHKKNTIFDAFLLGFTTYAIFDLTNLSLFKNYSYSIAIIDMLWGATLYSLTTYFTRFITN